MNRRPERQEGRVSRANIEAEEEEEEEMRKELSRKTGENMRRDASKEGRRRKGNPSDSSSPESAKLK